MCSEHPGIRGVELKMPKGQWNVIVYYAHSSVFGAIGRRHRARVPCPKGSGFVVYYVYLALIAGWRLLQRCTEVLAVLSDNCALASQVLSDANWYSSTCSMKLWWGGGKTMITTWMPQYVTVHVHHVLHVLDNMCHSKSGTFCTRTCFC